MSDHEQFPIPFEEASREVRLAVKAELARRAVEIVTSEHPKPVLWAEIQARISESAVKIDEIEGESLEPAVYISEPSINYAINRAIYRGQLVDGHRGNQLTCQLPSQ